MVAIVADRLLLPVAEAAAVLGLGRTKTYDLIARGELESVFLCGRRLVPRAALEEFVDRLRAPETPA